MINVLKLTLVFELAILVNSFFEGLELETILPDKELEHHADVKLILQIKLLVDL